jgi:hypothetical protein
VTRVATRIDRPTVSRTSQSADVGFDDAPLPRFASRGRAFVYIAPCRDDNVFKIGFSRNPLERFRTLHARFFDFFDLERGVLLVTDRVRDARRLERRLITALADFQALAPLVVPTSAAGHTEWFRGALEEALAIVAEFETAEGFEIHRPASAWFRQILRERADLLYAWSARMLEAIEYETHNGASPDGARAYENSLRQTLDAYAAFAIDVDPLLPSQVVRWYAAQNKN